MDDDVWLITGASSGFGRAIAEAALARGHRVVATARDPRALAGFVDSAPDRACALALDVASPASIDAAVAVPGRIDVLVNNAGYGLLGAVEEIGENELLDAYQTNLFGAVRLVRAVLPGMRRRRHGRIVQMSSVIGVTSGLGGSAYAGPKAALEAMSEALAAEVASWDIRVTIVQPGAFRTEFTGRSLRRATPLEPYVDIVGPPARAFAASHGSQRGDPRRGAEAIVRAVESDDPPLRLPLGDDAFDWIGCYLAGRLEALEAARPLGAGTDFR